MAADAVTLIKNDHRRPEFDEALAEFVDAVKHHVEEEEEEETEVLPALQKAVDKQTLDRWAPTHAGPPGGAGEGQGGRRAGPLVDDQGRTGGRRARTALTARRCRVGAPNRVPIRSSFADTA